MTIVETSADGTCPTGSLTAAAHAPATRRDNDAAIGRNLGRRAACRLSMAHLLASSRAGGQGHLEITGDPQRDPQENDILQQELRDDVQGRETIPLLPQPGGSSGGT